VPQLERNMKILDQLVLPTIALVIGIAVVGMLFLTGDLSLAHLK
jgi:amino acid transporter